MQEEIKFIENNETCELTILPAHKKPIGVKWMHKTKKNPDGSSTNTRQGSWRKDTNKRKE